MTRWECNCPTPLVLPDGEEPASERCPECDGLYCPDPDDLEHEFYRGVPGASTPRGLGTLAPGAESPMNAGDSGVPTVGTPGTPLAPAAAKLRELDVDRMLDTPPPPVPWVVEPLLVEGCVTMLAGREGQGKSMLALGLTAAMGRGDNLAGFECQQGKVLYVDAENGEREAHRRVHGLGVKRGALVYVEADGFNLAADIVWLAGLVEKHSPSLVVLDSLRSLAPGLDENDSRQAEAAVRPVSRLAQGRNIPVLLLHHAGKGGHEYRGSTAIGAAVELGFTLSRHEEDPERASRRKLACWKCRPDREPKPRWLSLDADDDGILIAAAEPFEPGAVKRDGAAEDLLASLNGRPTSWADWARAAGMDPKNGTARRARERLEQERRVYRDERGGWLKAWTLASSSDGEGVAR